MDALLWELMAEGSPDDQVEVLIKLSEIIHIPDHALEIVARIGNVASCRICRGDIEQIRKRDWVISMKASRPLILDPTLTEDGEVRSYGFALKPPQSRRPETPFTGKNVYIGIADWGFDFTHPNFQDADGNTRFAAIWDQGAAYDGKNIYGYGAVHDKRDINEALGSDQPFRTLNYYPSKNDILHQGMHGTHVLDIAAGSGAVGDTGIAPSADLIAVHLATDQFKDLMGLGDSVRVFDAIHFLDSIAETRPLVINMSVGSHGDAHMGRSLIEQAIDHLVTSGMNRAVAQSCGNYYSSRVHSGGRLAHGGQQRLAWLISREDTTPNELEIWFGPEDQFEIDLLSPAGEVVLQDKGVGKSGIDLNGVEIGRFYYRINEPNTQLSQILIILSELAPPGKWEVILHGKHIRDGRFETYIERDAKNGFQSRFSREQAIAGMTTGSICNGFYTICVGAVDTRNEEIGPFSSMGPTWDGRQKPDFAAPGVSILAAKSAAPFETASSGELTVKTGTSMAAPFVTGAVALLYEALARPVPIQEIKQRLIAACRPPRKANSALSSRFGQGILDLKLLLSRFGHPTFHHSTNTATMYSNNDHIKNGEHLLETFPELAEGSLAEFYDSLAGEDLAGLQKGDYLFRRVYGHPESAWGGIVEYVDRDEAWVRTRKAFKKVNTAKSGWEMKRVKGRPFAKKQPPQPPEAEPEEPVVPDAPPEPEAPNMDAPAAEYYPYYDDFEEEHPDQVKLIISWSGYYPDAIAANIRVMEQGDSGELGSGTGNDQTEIIVAWKKNYHVVITPTDAAPNNYYLRTSVVVANTVSETALGTPSLSVRVKLIINHDNRKNVLKSWDIKGVNTVLAQKTERLTLMGFNVLVNSLVAPRVRQTQAAFEALPAVSRQQIIDSLGSMGGYNLRTQKNQKTILMSLHSLGCAIDVNEHMETHQNTDFDYGDRKHRALLDLVEAIVRLQPGKATFDIGTARDMDQLNASLLFNSVFPGWLYQQITTLAPPPAGTTPPAEAPSPRVYSNEHLSKAIKKAKENGQSANAVLLQIVKKYKNSLAAWIEGTPKGNTRLYGMIPMDPLFLKLMLDNGWGWGGNYTRGEKDYMHFEDKSAENTLLAPPASDPVEGYGDEEDVDEWLEAAPTKEEEAHQKRINEYNPEKSHTLVINTQEFDTGIAGIVNYRGWPTSKNIPHNRKLNGYRKPAQIRHLILHETASETGPGFNVAENTTAHLSVQKDGTIIQFNDIVEFEHHARGMHETSLGIEFVNKSWPISELPNKLTEKEKEKYPESEGYFWVLWTEGFRIYKLPEIKQLEKVVELVKWITTDLKIEAAKRAIQYYREMIVKMNKQTASPATLDPMSLLSDSTGYLSSFPVIDSTWLQLVSYNEVKNVWAFKTDDIPPKVKWDQKNLFVMTRGYEFLFNDKLKNTSGIISHNAFMPKERQKISDLHADGAFISLYTWLRIRIGKEPEAAFELAKKLMKEHAITVGLKTDRELITKKAEGHSIILLDVQDENLV